MDFDDNSTFKLGKQLHSGTPKLKRCMKYIGDISSWKPPLFTALGNVFNQTQELIWSPGYRTFSLGKPESF